MGGLFRWKAYTGRQNLSQTDATQRTLLAESYYGLSLAKEVAAVRQDTYNGLKQHYENALKLEAAGMIDKAGRLFAQVNMDEAWKVLYVLCSIWRTPAKLNLRLLSLSIPHSRQKRSFSRLCVRETIS